MCNSGNSIELRAGDAMITYKDLRPVVCVPVSVVKAQTSGNKSRNVMLGTKMKFVKLHKRSDSLVPYLPLVNHRVRGGDCCVNKDSELDSAWLQMENQLPDFPDGDDDVEECIYSRQYFAGCNEYDRVLERSLEELIRYRDESVHCRLDTREKWNVSMAIEAIQASLRRWMGSDGCDGGFRSIEVEVKANSVRETTMVVPISNDSDNANEEADQTANSALVPPGTVHLNRDMDECLYYQAYDGQLCYLSGLNVACLLHEFSLYGNEHSMNESDRLRRTLPLPDYVEGTVVEVETMVVTPALVKRKHFLSHIPFGSSVSSKLFVDMNMVSVSYMNIPSQPSFALLILHQVVFAELDWYSGGDNGHKPMLTKATLNKFHAEIQRRKSDRQRASQLEEKNDKAARAKAEKEDRRRRKEAFGSAYVDGISRQTIDPNDEFFQVPSPSMDEELDGANNQQQQPFKFNQVCAEGGAFPDLVPSSPVTRVKADATITKSPQSLPSWGDASRKHLVKQVPVVKPNPQVEAFPSLAQATQSNKSYTQSSHSQKSLSDKSCWNKFK
jgi:hypothetical protein